MSGRLGSRAKPGHLGAGGGRAATLTYCPLPAPVLQSLLSMSVTPAQIQDLSTWKAFCGPTVCSAGPGWVPRGTRGAPPPDPRACLSGRQAPQAPPPLLGTRAPGSSSFPGCTRTPTGHPLEPAPGTPSGMDTVGSSGRPGKGAHTSSIALRWGVQSSSTSLGSPRAPSPSLSGSTRQAPPTSPAAWLALDCGQKPPRGPRFSYRVPLGARLPVLPQEVPQPFL